MRVDAYSKVSQVYGVNAKSKTTSTKKAYKTDQVEISSVGQDLQIAKKAVADSPEVRAERVAELKTKIDNGTYEVDMDSFADVLLGKLQKA